MLLLSVYFPLCLNQLHFCLPETRAIFVCILEFPAQNIAIDTETDIWIEIGIGHVKIWGWGQKKNLHFTLGKFPPFITLNSFKISVLSVRNCGACFPTVWKINRRHSTLVNSNFEAASAIIFEGPFPLASSDSALSGGVGKYS